jgi:hypothetical protein
MATRSKRAWGRPVATGVMIAVVAAVVAWRNTGLHDPPRFDGAGYAVLARALASGQGYHEVDHPDAPRHAHFPPGYPAALATLWRLIGGPSSVAAHGLSLGCTLMAILVAWRWIGTMYSARVAGLLGLALAVNWTWARTAGAIQSEPLFLLLEALALLATGWASRRGGVAAGVMLGAILSACVLTRHVGAALAVAVMIDLLLRRRRPTAVAAGLTCLLLLLPWVVWLATVRENTQAGLLARDDMASRIVSQAVFYLQRLPDQLTGPVVEVGTVFLRRGAIPALVNLWAAMATGVLALGWARTLRTPRRRLAGLTAIVTLALLLVWPFTEAGRFLIPLVPCLLVGAVEGLAALAARLRARVRVGRPRELAAAVVLAASLPYTGYALATNRAEAQRRTHADFDAACAWIAIEGTIAGPVLTRHPGEVYWQTGRKALAPASDDPEAIVKAVDRWRVAYLLIDAERYANAPANPLFRFIQDHPERVREVWSRDAGRSSIRVYEVVNAPGPRTGGSRNPRNGGSSAGAEAPNSS